MSAAEVAEAGWNGLLAGRSSVVPGWARGSVSRVRFIPWRTVARVAAVKPPGAVPGAPSAVPEPPAGTRTSEHPRNPAHTLVGSAPALG